MRSGLPDFLIIGAQKGGTSSLHRYLEQHPQVAGSSKKEVHFFDGGRDPEKDTYALGLPWYLSHFPATDNRLTFESSPLYIYSPLAPGRIRHTIPDAKLIALLRNPVERAISHYFHNARKRRREPLGLLAALEQESERTAGVAPNSTAFRHYSYKARGHYAEQLRLWFDLFDSNQLLILDSATLFADPPRTVEAVLAWLGLSMVEGIDFSARNVGTNKGEVDPAARRHLEAYFAPLNEDLFDLLGRRFAW